MTNKKYLSLITSQHRKPKFISTVQASIDPLIDCIDFLKSINDGFDLESATDLPLQIIAEWVGAANSIPNSIPIAFFGFEGQQGSLPMRETNDPTFVSGYWRESGVSGFRALSGLLPTTMGWECGLLVSVPRFIRTELESRKVIPARKCKLRHTWPMI
ncbi:hypothetical protein D3C80_969880 [compost metagenome]